MRVGFQIPDRKTPYILPASPDDWLPPDHLARFIVEVVENLELSSIVNAYNARGKQAYHPRLLLSLLFYGYATGVYSSRKIERATHDSVAFRYISGDMHPDHDTISTFRKRFLPELGALFVQILQIAHEMGFLNLGTISLDGTKIKANASKHSALSWEYANKIEEQLKNEVAELLKKAEDSDNESVPDGLDIPEELSRREDRLAAIARAKEEIARRAQERHNEEQAAYEKKMAAREEKSKASGKKARGQEPTPPKADGPCKADQVNLTDSDSRIMHVSGGGFEQCYNAQAGVDVESMLIITQNVTQKPNDKRELAPFLEAVYSLPEELGKVNSVLADAGYCSEENVKNADNHNITPYICVNREPHNQRLSERFSYEEPVVSEAPFVQMKNRLKTQEGRALYAKRKCTVEPVFGVIKAVMGFRQFLLRGIESVKGEWNLVCVAWNLKRLHTLRG
jgi:transposase